MQKGNYFEARWRILAHDNQLNFGTIILVQKNARRTDLSPAEIQATACPPNRPAPWPPPACRRPARSHARWCCRPCPGNRRSSSNTSARLAQLGATWIPPRCTRMLGVDCNNQQPLAECCLPSAEKRECMVYFRYFTQKAHSCGQDNSRYYFSAIIEKNVS